LRDPTDCRQAQTKPTPPKEVIENNILTFLMQWKDVEHEGTKLVPECAVSEINKLLVHVRKGCLSGIAPSGGTSRNKGIHRVLNKTLKKSPIGVQFARALLGMLFYMWNEKRISADTNDKQSKVRIIPPIESYFNKLENTTEITVESFGIQGHSVPSETDMDKDDENTSCLKEQSVDSSVANIVTKVNSFLREDVPTSSSDEDEYCDSASVNSTLPLSDEFKRQVLNNSKVHGRVE
jgi:hypothetical protein